MRKICGLLLCFLMTAVCAFAMADVAIDEAHFDGAFLYIVSQRYDLNKDNILSDDEISRVSQIDVNEIKLTSLKGVEYFTALKYLYCRNCALKSLDVSHSMLDILDCSGNQLTALNVSYTPLSQLFCHNNQLSSLDLSQTARLVNLYVQNNRLSVLDVSKCVYLDQVVSTGKPQWNDVAGYGWYGYNEHNKAVRVIIDSGLRVRHSGGETDTTVPVSSVTLNRTEAAVMRTSVKPGPTVQLTATVAPSYATNKSVQWISSDTNVASVDGNGLVTGRGPGSAIITCTAKDGSGVSAMCTISVSNKKVEGIQLTAYELVLVRASTHPQPTHQLHPSVTPYDAVDKGITWSSSDASVASVDSTGLITGLKDGSAVITCRANDGSGIKAECKVTVRTAHVTLILLDRSEAIIGISAKDPHPTLQLQIERMDPSDALDPTVQWSSSDTKVATVDQNGLVTAQGAGKATITCAARDGSGKKATCEITVVNNQLITQIKLSHTSATLKRAKNDRKPTLKLKATVYPTSAASAVKWTSSNSKVATVNQQGKVTGLKKGTAVITCWALDGSGIKAKCTIKVKDTLVTSIKLNYKSATLKKGKKLQLKATVKPSYALDTDVTWKSSNKKVATVNKNGLVTARKKGKCTITCTAADGSKVKVKCKITVK